MNEQALRELALSVIGHAGLDATEVDFRSALWDAGLARVQYPKGKGGLDLSPQMQGVIEEAIREAGRDYNALSLNVIGIGMGLPTVLTYGSDDHHVKYLKRIFTGEDIWCQMFSEPSHGSDVAGLSSRAVRDGDEWIINGQKVWTSGAHHSRYGMLLVRTDPDVPKHKGLSYFILDMHSPGVDIRPLYQITGNAEFNEVFFTDVRIPKDHLLGEYNAGWKLATAMLMYERVAIGGAGSGKINQPTYKLLKSAAEESGKLQDPVVRDQLMKIYAMETTKSMVAMRNNAEQKAGKTPGPGGSLGKLFGSNIAWKMREIALEIAGMSSIAWDPADASGAERQRIVLNSFQSSIAGGTDEIQRNIIGDRVLGLPRDISVDKGVPFNQTKVGTQA